MVCIFYQSFRHTLPRGPTHINILLTTAWGGGGGGGGGSERVFFGSEILAKRVSFWVCDEHGDFFGYYTFHQLLMWDFFGYAKTSRDFLG